MQHAMTDAALTFVSITMLAAQGHTLLCACMAKCTSAGAALQGAPSKDARHTVPVLRDFTSSHLANLHCVHCLRPDPVEPLAPSASWSRRM